MDYEIVDYLSNEQEAYYLAGLSTDAAPVLTGRIGEWADDYLENIENDFNEGMREYNFSHAKARKLYAQK